MVMFIKDKTSDVCFILRMARLIRILILSSVSSINEAMDDYLSLL